MVKRQIRIYFNNDRFNHSMSGRELNPEEVDDELLYDPADPHINIYHNNASPRYNPHSPEYEQQDNMEMDIDQEPEPNDQHLQSPKPLSVDSEDSEDPAVHEGPSTDSIDSDDIRAARERRRMDQDNELNQDDPEFPVNNGSGDEEMDEEDDNAILAFAGPDDWETTRHRLNLQAIVDGTIRQEPADDMM